MTNDVQRLRVAFQRFSTLVLVALPVGAPFASAQTVGAKTSSDGMSVALFSAVVRAVRDSSKHITGKIGYPNVTVSVDPRPLRTRPINPGTAENALVLAGNPVFDYISASALAERRQALRREGVKPGDANSLNGCMGTGLLLDSASRHPGFCPDSATAIVTFGLIQQAVSRATVEVSILVAPVKKAWIADYTLVQIAGRWRVVRIGVPSLVE